MCKMNECASYDKTVNGCMGECAENPAVYVVIGEETVGLCLVDKKKNSTALGIYPASMFDADGMEVSVINHYGFTVYGDEFDEESAEMQYLYDNAVLVTDEEFTEIIS